MLRIVSILLLAGFALTSRAAESSHTLDYGGSVNTTEWSISGSVFDCRFEQNVPGYGTAVFFHRAGEDAVFQLETRRNLMDYSNATISILPPPWQPSGRVENLGTSKVSDDEPNLILDNRRTNQFIHALLEGKWPTITHRTYYDDNRFIKVHVSAVTFDRFYEDFLLCVDQLLPVNFDQVARSKVFFGSGEKQIDLTDQEILDTIIFYIKNDPRVFAVYLDGHSDNVGRRYDNRQISKFRVEDVERYFIKQGIDPEIITTRFHGSRYPVGTNATARGRAENRRVTIRLEQRKDMEIPPELLFSLPVRPTLNTAGQ